MVEYTEQMPGAERDDDSGQYTETYDTERFLSAIRDSEGMTGTQDVADAVGCEYETAYKRLRKLAEEGTVDSQKVANARVWLVDDGGDAAETEPETEAETETESDAEAGSSDWKYGE